MWYLANAEEMQARIGNAFLLALLVVVFTAGMLAARKRDWQQAKDHMGTAAFLAWQLWTSVGAYVVHHW